MASGTRSARKSKDEADDHSSKRKVNVRKDSSVRSPGSGDRTSTSRQMTPSPQSTRKSSRLDKEMPPLTPVNRKLEKLGKYNTPSHLRRSDRGKKDISSPSPHRGKKNLSSFSTGSKQSAKEPSPLESKRKKEKPLVQLTMKSLKAELDQEAAGMKRKKMDARSFKALFKMQRIHETVPDGGEELGGSEKLFDVCSDDNGDIGSDPTGVIGKLRGEGVNGDYGAVQESFSTMKGCSADVENDIHVDSRLEEDVVNEPCSKYSHACSSVRKMSGNPERLPKNCYTIESVVASESESSACSARSQGGPVSLGSWERFMHPEVATKSPPSNFEYCNLLGTCDVCSKNKRVGYESPEQELCSCTPMVNEDLGCSTTCKARSDHGAAVSSDSQRDGRENVCAVCKKKGELLSCVGKGCKRCYHLCCLDPSLTDVPPGVWHCPHCVKRKILFGLHSVSEGVDSIWDVREVEESDAKGVWQRQYLVKYHGLAHIHNHWVPEKQLLHENACLVSDFVENNQIGRWNAEWMVPHRLLRKRTIQDKIYIASSAVILVYEFEWLVKWSGLDYEHSTWELDNSNFLTSSLGQDLIKKYESRRQKAKQEANKLYMESIVKLPELPASRLHVNKNYVLKNVNKLRECLFKSLNAVVLDDQERAMALVSFIQSLSEICWPFLIVTTSGSLPQWESEFAQLAPSLDVVVYTGSAYTRKGIRRSEFYDEEGCMMVQVLLSTIEAIYEDLEILRNIKWKAVVIDDCQHSEISNAFEKIKILQADSRILLLSDQIEDSTSEYLKILSLLEPRDLDKLRTLKPNTNDNLCKLKYTLSRFIAYGRTSHVSKFIEYWVPVQISNYQLEQYCSTLLSNSVHLCSCSRNDRVRALRDILLTVRKCCNHPYLLDPSLQSRLIDEKRPAAELLDIGIKASGKLQLLDVMLKEIKSRGLRVLILYQMVIGSTGTFIGDILDDFLRQRFGQDTYERVDAGVITSKKQAAVNRFNRKETGQFVFLLENRACSATIKLSSLDVVVIYDSEWNPASDLRVLQRISIDSKVEQIKVFRLYSSFTIEERALVLAKKNLNLDNNLQNFSRTTSDTLLSWGATHLFSKLEEHHADSKSGSAYNFTSEQLLLDEVTKEFQAILSKSYGNTDLNSIISEAKLGVGSYSTNIPALGEARVQFKNGEEPHVFWKNLFDGKNPKWQHLKGQSPSPRNRKRVHYWEGSPSKSENVRDDMVKKHKKMVNENTDPALVRVESGPSTIKACNQSEDIQRDGQNSSGAEVSKSVSSKERTVSSDEQKSLQSRLHVEMIRLCQTLKFTEDVTHIVRKFLEYVIKNHHINSDSPLIVQAFQMSLCWIAASIAKQKIDKKDSFTLATTLLNYQCTEEQANSVYSKMRSLKRMFLQSTDNFENSDRDAEGLSLVQKNSAPKDKSSAIDIYHNKTEKIQRKCGKRMKKLVEKHHQEIQELQQIWKTEREELEKDHRLELAFVRSIDYRGSVGLDKLKLLEDKFANKMEELNLLKAAQLKELEAKQLAAIDEEKQKAAEWLAKINACSTELRATNGEQLPNSQPDDDGECPQLSVPVNSEDVLPMSGQHLENESPRKSFCIQGTDVAPLTSSISAPVDAIRCEATIENDVTTTSQKEARAIPLVIDEVINQSKYSCDIAETVSANLPAPMEQLSDEIPSVGPSVEVSVPNEIVDFVQQQDSDVPAVENQNPSQIEVATSVPMASVTSALANLEIPATDGIANPSPSSHEDPANENSVQLHYSLVGTPLSCNQAPATEHDDQGRSSSQTVEPGGVELLCHESISQSGENFETHSNQLDIRPSSDAACGRIESSPVFQNNAAIPQVVASTSEQSNQAVSQGPQLDLDASNLHQPTYPVVPNRQPTPWNSAPSLLIHPLEGELERIHKETEQLEKTHKDMVSQLKSDCEKEMEELVALIRKKYEVKLQETEAGFRLKRNELDRNKNKVLLNKILAEAFRSKCLDPRPSGSPGLQQGVPTNVMQQLPRSPPIRRSPMVSSCSQPSRTQPFTAAPAIQPHSSRSSPAAIQSITPPSVTVRPIQGMQQAALHPLPTSPTTQTMQQLSRPHSLRPIPAVVQSVAPPSVTFQPVQPHLSCPPSRPLVINAITPGCNPRVGGNEIRSIAPHLQPSRPHSNSPSVSQIWPVQRLPSQTGPPQRAPHPPLPPSPTMQGPGRRASLLPDISSTFGALELSDLEMMGNVQCNVTSAVASAVVCLSDDE